MNIFSSKPVQIKVDLTELQPMLERFEQYMKAAVDKKVSKAFDTGAMVGFVGGAVLATIVISVIVGNRK